MGFPGGPVIKTKNPPANAGDVGSIPGLNPRLLHWQETWVQSLDWEDALEEEMATHSCILAGKSHRQRNLEGHSPWGHKESDMTEQLSSHKL